MWCSKPRIATVFSGTTFDPLFMSDSDYKILADDPELAGNPFLSFRIHVTGEKLLAAIKEAEALAEWLEPRLIAERRCR
jgi:hypothetical protein